jgi:serine/threonine-protein kinase
MTELVAGQTIGRSLRLVEQLGAGGMGSVWVAEHTGLRTHVAVKFLARELVHDTESNARFAREAAAASSVKSPHVVQMLDYGLTDDGVAYIVMELLEGRDLARRIREHGPLGSEEVVHIVDQVATALDRAHARNVIHRDIKPENIFLCDVGGDVPFVKILDFGVAKEPRNTFGTLAGELLGTPSYMSPEQLEGAHTVDARTDLWSLGVVAYEALTATPAFDGATIAEIVTHIHMGPMPLPSRVVPDLPRSVDEWFLRACARKPQNRFASGREMARALGLALGVHLTRDSGSRARPLPPLPRTVSEPSFADHFNLPKERRPVGWLVLALVLASAVALLPMATKRFHFPASAAPAPAPTHPASAFGGGAPATSEDEPAPSLPVPLPSVLPSASTSVTTSAATGATTSAAPLVSSAPPKVVVAPPPKKPAVATPPPAPAPPAKVDAGEEKKVEADATPANPTPSVEPATDAAPPPQKELVPDDVAPKNDDPYGGGN